MVTDFWAELKRGYPCFLSWGAWFLRGMGWGRVDVITERGGYVWKGQFGALAGRRSWKSKRVKGGYQLRWHAKEGSEEGKFYWNIEYGNKCSVKLVWVRLALGSEKWIFVSAYGLNTRNACMDGLSGGYSKTV